MTATARTTAETAPQKREKPGPLTPARIKAILRNPPAKDRVDVYDGGEPGLFLRVAATGSKKWMLRLHIGGSPGIWRKFVLGDYTDRQGLSWARDEARKLRQQFKHEGRDPKREREERIAAEKAKAERNRLTLGVLVDDWKRIRLATRSERYRAEAARALKTAFTKQWERPADSLDRATVIRTLDALVRPEKAPKRRRGINGDGRSIAGRTAAYGRACFAWAVKRGVLASNPFANLPAPEASPARERVLSDNEIAAVWRAAENAEAKVFGSLVRLLILTGQRREEVAGMAWSEISPDRDSWMIPAERTKNGKPHLVPLSDAARAVLPVRPEGATGLVFPGQREGKPFAGWSKCKADLDKDAGMAGWRIHDLRRTLATGLQRLGVRLEVTEAVLNHISGSRAGIVGIYQRHDWKDEKRAALDAWATRLRRELDGKAAGENVVALRAA